MGRHKRIHGLVLRTRPSTDEERLIEIRDVFIELGEEPTPEKVANQFYNETRRTLSGKFIRAVLQ